jgi:hypothetical protein
MTTVDFPMPFPQHPDVAPFPVICSPYKLDAFATSRMDRCEDEKIQV